MSNKMSIYKSLEEERALAFLEENLNLCDELMGAEFKFPDISDYKHNVDLAVEELGLDDELIDKLVEDYVIQIMRTEVVFFQHLNKLKDQKKHSEELDYTSFRELAHKNLGVARNLRIEDAKKLLKELMVEDDLEHLETCLRALIACAVKLKPKLAYNIFKLMKIKKSLQE